MVNHIVITLYGDSNYTYGEHCSMYGIAESLHYAPETNIALYVNCILVIKKLIKILRI